MTGSLPPILLGGAALSLAAAALTFRRDRFHGPGGALLLALLRGGTLLAAFAALAGGAAEWGRAKEETRPPRVIVAADGETLSTEAGRRAVQRRALRETERGQEVLLLLQGDPGNPRGLVSPRSIPLRAAWESAGRRARTLYFSPRPPPAAMREDRTLEWIPPAPPPPPPLRQLQVPPEALAGAPVRVRVEAAVPPAGLRLLLAVDGRGVAERALRGAPGGEREAREEFLLPPLAAGEHSLRLTAADAEGQALEVRGSTLTVRPRPRVTYVSPGEEEPPLARLLAAAGFAVERLPSSALSDPALSPLARAQEGELVVLEAPPPAVLAQVARDADAAVARRGASLLFIPGSDLWARDAGLSPLGPLLPVELGKEPGERKESRSLALVVMVDTSMSMRFPQASRPSEPPKIEMAKRALLNLAQALPEEHRLGILGVDFSPYWITLPSRPRDRRKEEELTRKLTAFSGGINLYSGLLAASRELGGVEADRKHVVVLLDSADVDEYMVEGTGTVWDLIQELSRGGVTVSFIGFGDPGDPNIPLLSRLAEDSGGYLYVAGSGEEVPSFFLQDLARQEDRLPVDRPSRVIFTPAEFPSFPTLPPVAGQIRAQPRAGAALYAWSEAGYALLAGWRVGRGQVTVFASDGGRKLAGEWVAPGAAPLWEAVVAKAVRGGAPSPLYLARGPEEVRFSVALPAEAEPPRALLHEGARAAFLPTLEETGAGEYSLTVPASPLSPIFLELLDGKGRVTASRSLPAAPALVPGSGPALAFTARSGAASPRPPLSSSPPPLDLLLDPFLAALLALAAAALLILDELFRFP